MEAVTDAPGCCSNCGSALQGKYCHHCGQKHVGDDWLSAARLLRQFGRELVRGDFKSLQSLGALFAPGYLPAEFLAGRRQRFLGPLKMYLLAAALFFVAAPYVGGFNLEDRLEQDTTLQALVDRRLAERPMDFAVFSERFNRRLQTVYTLSLGLSVVGVALILRALFRRQALPFGSHIVFALYYIAFFYVTALATGALYEALRRPGPLTFLAITYGILTPYAFFALRRVYREPAGRTLLKCVLLLVAAFAVDIPINIAAIRLTLASI